MQLLRVFGSRTVIVRRQGLLQNFVDQTNNKTTTALHTQARAHTDKALFCLQSRSLALFLSLALEKKRSRYVLSLSLERGLGSRN